MKHAGKVIKVSTFLYAPIVESQPQVLPFSNQGWHLSSVLTFPHIRSCYFSTDHNLVYFFFLN